MGKCMDEFSKNLRVVGIKLLELIQFASTNLSIYYTFLQVLEFVEMAFLNYNNLCTVHLLKSLWIVKLGNDPKCPAATYSESLPSTTCPKMEEIIFIKFQLFTNNTLTIN